MQGPLGGICIEWCDFCFQRGKFYKLCFTLISAWAVSSWENSFLLGKNGCEALATTKGRFYCKENCLLLLPKEAKHMRQNHKYFPVCKPCENVIFHQWWEYFPTLLFPFLKIMVSMAKVTIYTYKTSSLQSNSVNIGIKHVGYIFCKMWYRGRSSPHTVRLWFWLSETIVSNGGPLTLRRKSERKGSWGLIWILHGPGRSWMNEDLGWLGTSFCIKEKRGWR